MIFGPIPWDDPKLLVDNSPHVHYTVDLIIFQELLSLSLSPGFVSGHIELWVALEENILHFHNHCLYHYCIDFPACLPFHQCLLSKLGRTRKNSCFATNVILILEFVFRNPIYSGCRVCSSKIAWRHRGMLLATEGSSYVYPLSKFIF